MEPKPKAVAEGGADRALPRPRALVGEVYNAILDRITSLEIVPGARINMDTLARELGVSPTPVREALSRLEAEGLVLKTHLVGHRALPQLTREQVEQLFELRLLIEPAGAAMAARRLDALKFSRVEAALIHAVIRAHMRPLLLHFSFGGEPISRRARYRFFRDSEGRTADALVGIATVLLALADYQAIYAASPPPAWADYVRHMGELIAYGLAPDGLDEVRAPLIDGHTLMAYFDLRPGRQVGVLLEQLREAQAAGEIATAEEGLALAAQLLAQDALP